MLKIDFKKKKDLSYDDWLDYFSIVSAKELSDSEKYLKDNAPMVCYAAATRWLEILDNPSKMDKLYAAQLKAKQQQDEEDIMDVAVGEDDEKFYEVLIKKNVSQLDTSNISQQEVARLTQNINVFRKELRDIRSRKPKKDTVLAEVLKRAAKAKNKKSANKNEVTTAKTSKNAKKKTRKTARSTKSANSPKNKASKTPSKSSLEEKTVKVSSKEEKANEGVSEA